jgi:cytochrome c-type biogenesis protein
MGSSGSIAFVMGMAAVFNPCGIALLPASLAWVGGTVVTGPAHPVVRWGHGLTAGMLMALGFTAVVAVLGLLVHGVGMAVAPVLRPAMVTLGGLLIVAGLAVALGLFHFPIDRWLRLQRVPQGPWGWTFVVAGVIYGFAALSCTLPLFVAALLPALTAGGTAFLTVVATFGAGAAVVLVGVSEVTLLARDTTTRVIRGIGPWLNPILGLLVVGAGGYLLFYWIWGAGRFVA